MIAYGTEQGVPAALSERTMLRVLTTALRLSVGEASRRVKAADHLADRTSLTGEPLTPIRPHLAAAQRDGTLTPEQVTLIDTALRKVKHCDPAAVDAGELLLVQQAGRLGYQDLSQVAARLVDAIDPDGVAPADEAEHRLRRFFHLTHRKDGSWAGDFRLTPDVGQKLAALLGPLTTPHTTKFQTDADPGTGDTPARNTSLRTSAPTGNAATTRWRRSSTPPSAPTTSPPPAAPRPRCCSPCPGRTSSTTTASAATPTAP